MLRHYPATATPTQLLLGHYNGTNSTISYVSGCRRDGYSWGSLTGDFDGHVIIVDLARDRRKNRCEGTVQKCQAMRRRVRYEEEDEEEEGSEYGYNEDVAMMEVYSQSARGEALLVKAMVDDREEEVLIFKGYSSCLTSQTPSDPSKSALPARAEIKSVDRVKGPFDPSEVQYIEKGLTWDDFKRRLP